MKSLTAMVFFSLAFNATAANFDGLWFRCDDKQKMYEVVELQSGRTQYQGTFEQSKGGGIYGADVHGVLSRKKIKLYGCIGRRGEVPQECNAKTAPILAVINGGKETNSFRRISHSDLDKAIAICEKESR
jgi:hypothetical protein